MNLEEQQSPLWDRIKAAKAKKAGGQTTPPAPSPKPTVAPRRTQKTPAAQLSTDFPDAGLTYGMRKNAYVQMIQKHFGFQPNYQTGNYLDMTKTAVAKWITENNYQNVVADGSVITYLMYLKILGVDEDGVPVGDANHKKLPNESPQTNGEQSKIQQTPNGSYSKGDVTFPMFLGQGDPAQGYDPATWGRFIEPLQNIIHAQSTGILDQQTFDAINKYINDPKYKQYFTEPIDSESQSLLRNQAKPGISTKLYNTILRSNDLRILKNRQAQNPSEIINEMSRMKFKLKRFFKK
jgi:hypothetical protein